MTRSSHSIPMLSILSAYTESEESFFSAFRRAASALSMPCEASLRLYWASVMLSERTSELDILSTISLSSSSSPSLNAAFSSSLRQ